jgi:hypothetical protein
MVRSTSPTRRRHARAAPSGFMAFYTENYNKFSSEYSKQHKTQANVTLISKIAATAYALLTDEEKSKYKNPDIKFFTAEPRRQELKNEAQKQEEIQTKKTRGAAQSPQKGEEKPPKEAEEKSPKEAEEKSPKETEEKSPKETEEKSPKETEEKSPKETEEKSPKETEEKSPKEGEKKSPKNTENELKNEGGEETQEKNVLGEAEEKPSVKSVKVDDITDDLEGFTFL